MTSTGKKYSEGITPEMKIWPEYFRAYNKKPVGWQILLGQSESGFPGMLLKGPEKSWLIERDSIYKPGLAVSMEGKVDLDMERLGHYSGYRPISDYLFDRLAEAIKEEAAEERISELVVDMLMHEPVSIRQIRKDMPLGILHGPVTHVPNPLGTVIKGQEELVRKLEYEIAKMRRSVSWYRA